MSGNDPQARPQPLLQWRVVVLVFLSFAFAYFHSAFLRGVTATLAPQFDTEFHLSSSDLGLLAGPYFLGFAVMQLPLGSALGTLRTPPCSLGVSERCSAWLRGFCTG